MMKITFLGDISLNDDYIKMRSKGINPFLSIESEIFNTDCVIGNLECIAKGEKGENFLKKPRLTTSVDTLDYLKYIRLSIACLAQNHIYDHLDDGFIKTTDFLNNNNIKFIGASVDINKVVKPIIIDNNGISIGVFNYVTKDTNINPPNETSVFLNVFDLDSVIRDIKEYKEIVDHIVLSLHWGGRVEGGLYPDWHQPFLAHKLIDAGADLIIGHHSHTVQPYEVYKGKYIFYSLGNFCFSDYWFDGRFYPMAKRRMITFIPIVSFEKRDYNIQFNYYQNNVNSYKKIKHERLHFFKNVIFNHIYCYYPFWKGYYFYLKNIFPGIMFFLRKDLTVIDKIHRFIKSILRKAKCL